MAEGNISNQGINNTNSNNTNDSNNTDNNDIAVLKSQMQDLQKKLDATNNQKQTEQNINTNKSDDDVIKKVQAEELRKIEEQKKTDRLQRTIKFNLSIDNFVETNKEFLPELTPKILQEIKNKNYSNEEELKKQIQKNLLVSFFSIQENIDVLSENKKPKILEYKALAEDEKEKQSDIYWELLEDVVDKRQAIRKAEEVKKANGGYINTDSDKKKYDDKVFGLKNHYIKSIEAK
ncbi:MAG: hypothetical protein LBF97_00740 [Elusimicrobiota bacterium]|jgi:hypothetical protein|nr:hypothetical protein [Elusimicrobiota bacterium]